MGINKTKEEVKITLTIILMSQSTSKEE